MSYLATKKYREMKASKMLFSPLEHVFFILGSITIVASIIPFLFIIGFFLLVGALGGISF